MLLVFQLLCFWLTETSIALLHFPSAREQWLFGKCTKGKGKYDLASTDVFSNVH